MRLVMIEYPLIPTDRVMTGIALFAKGVLVRIILMALLTGLRRAAKMRIGVACFAAHCGMSPQQRKRTQVMIETYFLAPAFFVVTLLAAGAQCPLMGILPRMTAVTGFVLDRRFDVIGMTLLTGHRLVCAVEQKAGFAVVKTRGFPLALVVTLLAIRAVAAFVHVILLMTTVTGGGRFGSADLVAMTRRARQ